MSRRFSRTGVVAAAALSALLALQPGCGGGGVALGDSQGFVVADSHVLPVNTGAGGEVVDSSGLRLRFPDGGQGELRLTKLSGVPAAPSPGQGWRVEFSASRPVELVVDGALDGSSSWPEVYAYDTVGQASMNHDLGAAPRWLPVPLRWLSSGRYAFELGAQQGSGAAALGERPLAAAAEQAQAAAKPVPRDYWVSTLDKNSSDVDRRVVRGLQAATYTDLVAAALPADVAKTFNANRARRIPAYGDDVDGYYQGFSFFTDYIRRFSPRITTRPSLDMAGLAHELGHYHTHLLVGDDVYYLLESTGYRNYKSQHGPLDLVNRHTINEEYAYVFEQFLIGTGGKYDLFAAADFLRNRPPGDVPSIEGFGAAMLASLVRPTTLIKSIDSQNKMVDAPVVGKTWSQLFGIVAGGKTDIDSLRRQIEGTLDADGRSRLQVNLQRIGWRYSATLRAVDVAGQPVANAEARLLLRNGGGEFVSDVGTTDAAGKLNLWFAFPGSSTLELKSAGQTLEGTVTINPDTLTTQRVALGDVQVLALETFPGLQEVCASFSYTTITVQSRISAGPFNRTECVTPSASRPLVWGGSRFSVQDGTIYAEGIYLQSQALLQGVKARRPLSGRYATTPPPLEIFLNDVPRVTNSAVIRFKLEGAAAAGRYTVNYQPEDDCSGGYCERRLVQAIDPATISLWVTFRSY